MLKAARGDSGAYCKRRKILTPPQYRIQQFDGDPAVVVSSWTPKVGKIIAENEIETAQQATIKSKDFGGFRFFVRFYRIRIGKPLKPLIIPKHPMGCQQEL